MDQDDTNNRRGKSKDAFRTISEVSDALNVPQHVLRFWEQKFSQLRPMKRAGGRRYYRPDDVDLLNAIRELLYGEGYTIRGVQKLLREKGAKRLVSTTASADEPDQISSAGPSAEAETGAGEIADTVVSDTAPPIPAAQKKSPKIAVVPKLDEDGMQPLPFMEAVELANGAQESADNGGMPESLKEELSELLVSLKAIRASL